MEGSDQHSRHKKCHGEDFRKFIGASARIYNVVVSGLGVREKIIIYHFYAKK